MHGLPGLASIIESINALPNLPNFSSTLNARRERYPAHPSEEQTKLLFILTQFEGIKERFAMYMEKCLAMLKKYRDTIDLEKGTGYVNDFQEYYPLAMAENAMKKTESITPVLLPWMRDYLHPDDIQLIGYILEAYDHLDKNGRDWTFLMPIPATPAIVAAFAPYAGAADTKEAAVSADEVRVTGLDDSTLERLSELPDRPDSGAGAPEL